MAQTTDVPSPLGWCSPCLGQPGPKKVVMAMTTYLGTAVCGECNEAGYFTVERIVTTRDWSTPQE